METSGPMHCAHCGTELHSGPPAPLACANCGHWITPPPLSAAVSAAKPASRWGRAAVWGAVGFFLLLPGGVLMAAGHGDIARSGLLLVLVGLALGVTQSVLPARSTGRTLALAGIAVLASLTAGAAALFSLVYAMCSQMK